MSDVFHFDLETLDPRNRRDGISAMLRVRDGARFLRPNLQSCIDVFDEIIAVRRRCSDDTPHLKAWSLAQDLQGLSLPTASDLAA